MCLAIPARVVEKLDGEQAAVDLGGIRKTISTALVPSGRPWAMRRGRHEVRG